MRLGVDIRVLMDNYYSGVSVFTFNLLSSLLKKDKLSTYRFFCNSFKRKKIDLSPENTVQTFYPNKIFNYLLQKTFSYPKLDKIIGGVDLFYSPHINFSSFSSKVKKVITIHDLSFLRYPEFFSQRKNFWHKSVNISKKIKDFDKIIAVSDNTKNDLIELLKISENKIEVVYPGITNNLFLNHNFSPDFLAKKYGISRSYVLYLGTIEPRKNIIGLIKAYNLLRDAGFDHLLVLAGSWGWKTKEIKKEWFKSRYKKDIIFTGYVPSEEKSVFYSQAELFVYPSFYEGFGFPPLEAMYFSLPVISSNVSSLPEVLSDSALLINPDKSGDLFEAMKILLIDQNLKTKLREKGKIRSSFFSWDKTSADYLKIFEKVYGQK
ncbi:MAG: glycosyltransferase family 1 protein [Patescibacteria group bacterium]|nr:glycosyltransferase family 4 protein [Patescibacteria group bacterium]